MGEAADGSLEFIFEIRSVPSPGRCRPLASWNDATVLNCRNEVRYMLIRIGYDIALGLPNPTAIVFLLRVHSSRESRLVEGENFRFEPELEVGRWTKVDFSGGFDLLETEEPKKLIEFAYMWGDLMELNIFPVLEDQEPSEALQKAMKKTRSASRVI